MNFPSQQPSPDQQAPRRANKPPPIPAEALRRNAPIEQREVKRGLEIGAATKASLEHPDRNEDAAYQSASRGLAFVGDGMGGVPAGEFASGAAASIMSERQRSRLAEIVSPEDKATLKRIDVVFSQSIEIPLTQNAVEAAARDALTLMNKKIEETVHVHPEVVAKGVAYFEANFNQAYDSTNPAHKNAMDRILSSVGTTGTLTKIWKTADGKAFVTAGSVGDSRAYIFREGKMIQLTKDHSPLQVLLDAEVKDETGNIIDGNDITKTISKSDIIALADKHPELQPLTLKILKMAGTRVAIKDIRNMMHMALGGATAMKKETGIDFVPSISTHPLEPGDMIIVASDGLLDNMSDRRIAITASTYADNPEAAARALQEEATEVSAKKAFLTAKKARGEILSKQEETDLARAKLDDVTVVVQKYHG